METVKEVWRKYRSSFYFIFFLLSSMTLVILLAQGRIDTMFRIITIMLAVMIFAVAENQSLFMRVSESTVILSRLEYLSASLNNKDLEIQKLESEIDLLKNQIEFSKADKYIKELEEAIEKEKTV